MQDHMSQTGMYSRIHNTITIFGVTLMCLVRLPASAPVANPRSVHVYLWLSLPLALFSFALSLSLALDLSLPALTRCLN